MSKRIRSFVVFGLAFVLCVSMSFTPVMAYQASAGSSDELTYEDFEGKNVEKLKKHKDTKKLVEDPELYRYYEVNKKGDLKEKKVELDEVDKFIQQMDKNAEGISDTRIAKMNSSMNCVGCGVSGLGKAETPSKYSQYVRCNCLDISWWQGNISKSSWKKIKDAGVKYVILRTSYTSLSKFSLNEDSKFAQNIERAYNEGIKVGVYHFSQAITVKEAKKEADYTLNIIEPYKDKIKLPVVLDYETNGAGRLNMPKLKKLWASGDSTKICSAFCDKVKEAGYKPMVYANYTMLNNYMDHKSLEKKYRIWLANYTTKGTATTYPGEYWMWQYSSSGKVNGLSGCIDMNYIFKNGQGGSKVKLKKSATESGSTGNSTTTAATTKPTTVPTTAATTAAGSYRAKTIEEANYRTGPGTNYKVKGAYKKGTIVTVVGTSGSWSKLDTGYYIFSALLKKTKYPYKVRTTDELNYRSGPGTEYDVLGTYKKGKKLTIVSKKKDWGKTKKGYFVYLKFTEKIEQ